MTALAGLWRFDGRPGTAECCRRMLASQELYGPHAGAQWAGADVAFGRRLMYVLPEDQFDRQPLVGRDGRYVLVADVRLDNRDELISDLCLPSDNARQSSDAAILLAAIERWGEACFSHLVGDYAFALWDRRLRRLLLARDPLGRRPLVYHRGKNFFAFATMAKGLHALDEVPHAPDEESAAKILALLLHLGPQTFFKGVERVLTGHVVIVTPTSFETHRHWEPKRQRIVLRGPDEYAEALREQLDRAVRCRLRGTGDIGARLSGGLDSSAVAATAARLLSPTGRRVVAFTAVPREGYDGRAPQGQIIDEGPGAAATAALYPNMEHILIHNGGHSPFEYLDRCFFLFERPLLSLGRLGSPIAINNAARERKLTTMLTGELGNIGLSYGGDLFPELLRTGHWLKLWREARAVTAKNGVSYRTPLAWTLGPWCPPWLWLWLNRTRGRMIDWDTACAIHPEFADNLNVSGCALSDGQDRTSRPVKDGYVARLAALQRMDPGNALKGTLAGWQIDERDPMADVRLLEFCLAVPPEQFHQDGIPRALARRTLADRLPKSVLEEKRRGVQNADWHERLTADREQISAELGRLENCPAAAKSIDLPRLRQLVVNWPQRDWDDPRIRASYSHAIGRAVLVGHFLRRASGSNA